MASGYAIALREREACDGLVADIINAHGSLDVLVNNAGVNIRKRPEEYDESEIHEVLETDLLVPFHLSVAAYLACMRERGGKIINVGSLLSEFGGAQFSAYAAAKGGLLQLTRSFAVAWAPDNVQVNAILPGWIDTDLTVSAREQVPGLNEKVVDHTPAGRWGRPHDFMKAVVFLAGPGSEFVNGSAITVDGGYGVAI